MTMVSQFTRIKWKMRSALCLQTEGNLLTRFLTFTPQCYGMNYVHSKLICRNPHSPSTSKCDLIWRKNLDNPVKMKSLWRGLTQYEECHYKKTMWTLNPKMRCEVMPEMPRRAPEAEREVWAESCDTASGSSNSAHTFVITPSLPDRGTLDSYRLIHRRRGILLPRLWQMNTLSQVNFLKITISLLILSPW